jgi:hypothetical protein
MNGADPMVARTSPLMVLPSDRIVALNAPPPVRR